MMHNPLMDALKTAPGIPPEILAQMERAVELAISGRKDPEFERALHAEAEKITEELRRKYGTLDIGVPAIRELRGELPE
jgi:hypothetical protein